MYYQDRAHASDSIIPGRVRELIEKLGDPRKVVAALRAEGAYVGDPDDSGYVTIKGWKEECRYPLNVAELKS